MSEKTVRSQAWAGDRTTWLAATLMVPIGLGLALYGLAAEFPLWRWELARAGSRAGLYLFFACPVMAGVCAWSAYRRRRDLRGLTDGLPDPGLVPRTAWLPVALVSLGTHVLVLVAHLLVAVFSHATGPVPVGLILTQFLAIGAFCAFGALCGAFSRSHLVAPAVLVALLGANTLLAQSGFRRISEVGTGVTDYVDLAFAGGYLGPKTVFFAALIVLALPWRGPRRPAVIPVLRISSVAVTVVSLFMIWTCQGPQLVLRPENRVCQGNTPEVCLPESMAGDATVVDIAVARALDALESAGVENFQPRVDVISRGAVEVPKGTYGLEISPADVHDEQSLLREVARGFSAAQMCDDLTSLAPPDDNVMVSRAALDGWLQTKLGAIEDGSFPPDGVQALEGYSHQQFREFFGQIWSCSTDVREPS